MVHKPSMPRSSFWLWLLTGLLLTGFPAVNFIYWPQVLRSGVLPSDGDRIGIPIFGSVLLALYISPLVLGIAWMCLRRYSPDTRFAAWRQDRPYRSSFASLIFGGGAALALYTAFDGLRADEPWYEFLFSGYFILWVPWLLAMRAALIEQVGDEPTYAER